MNLCPSNMIFNFVAEARKIHFTRNKNIKTFLSSFSHLSISLYTIRLFMSALYVVLSNSHSSNFCTIYYSCSYVYFILLYLFVLFLSLFLPFLHFPRPLSLILSLLHSLKLNAHYPPPPPPLSLILFKE